MRPTPSDASHETAMKTPILLLACMLLIACARVAALPAEPPSGPVADRPGEVDYRCRSDADCTVKNVGNCCGYYPACVNVDSPTFPEKIMEQCQREGLSSICGFREISACACVEGRCEAADESAQSPLETR